MIFDTHAHYNSRQYEDDRDQVLRSLQEAGVGKVVNISAEWDSLEATLQLTEDYPFVYGTVGIHPDHVGDLTPERLEIIRQLSRKDKILAIGEIGLDYHWMVSSKEEQKKWFIRQLELAMEENLPVVIHSRDAARDTFEIMKDVHAGSTPGVIHCYSGSVEMAREYVKLGYYLGIGGVVTFRNSKVLKRVVEEIPLSCLVLETDCPYLSPAPFRGKRNSSDRLSYVADAIASLKGCNREDVERITWENGHRLYGLPMQQA
ncbi:MAG: TatD family hydrolase [Eubacterium sp.]|nr:TatD family hydrolase [Eubacterium sp.]